MEMLQLIVWVQLPSRRGLNYQFILNRQPGVPSTLFLEKKCDADERKKLERKMDDAIAKLMGNTAQGGQFSALETLRQFGADFAQIVPGAILEILFCGTEPLLITTNDLMIPWEILYHNGTFLGLHRPVARACPVDRDQRRPPELPASRQTAALLIGNPNPSRADQRDGLKYPEREAQDICETLQTMQHGISPTLVPPAEIAQARLERELQQGGVVLHYGGHIIGGDLSADMMAIMLRHGEQLKAADIAQKAGAWRFVFINGCDSGRTEDRRIEHASLTELNFHTTGPHMKGIINAFMARGALVCVSTLWQIDDAQSYRFAKALYKDLAQGIPFILAVHRVRQALFKEDANGATWAAYTLLGQAELTLPELFQAAAQPQDRVAVAARPLPDIHQLTNPNQHHPRADEDEPAGEDTFGEASSADKLTRVFRRISHHADVTLAEDAREALANLFGWLQRTNWDFIARFDLFVGLALVDQGPLMQALALLGITPEEVQKANLHLFGKGREAGEGYRWSSGIRRTFERAIALAEADETAVTARHLTLALLQPPADGTVLKGLAELVCTPGELWHVLMTGSLPPPKPASMNSSQMFPRHESGQGEKDDRDHVANLPDWREDFRQATVPRVICLERAEEQRRLVNTLVYPTRNHVLLVGPVGVGTTTLCQWLAAELARTPVSATLAGIDGWAIYRVQSAQEATHFGAWLTNRLNDLQQLAQPSIIVLDNLAFLLEQQPDLAATLTAALPQPHLRLLATMTPDAFVTLRQAAQFRQLLQAFAPIDVPVPRPDIAQRMVAAHQRMIEEYYLVKIDPDVFPDLVRTVAEQRLVLPGAALRWLEDVCAAERLHYDQAELNSPDKTFAQSILPVISAATLQRYPLQAPNGGPR